MSRRAARAHRLERAAKLGARAGEPSDPRPGGRRSAPIRGRTGGDRRPRRVDRAGKYARVATHKRANTIRDYLISRGLPRERLVARGWDAERPVATNKTEEGRAKNRRVEIVLSTPPECAQLLGPPCGPIEQTY
ncbi:OmpA family protein [Nannocystis poenicansa]|uniref:OmpA family protein n=2 Tax=Nannocystis punicea TaxID=2995304 RepID=A0ABY7HJS7_9BACT|nr:OmpA family protein [Nannocystis poenicansa]